MLLFSSDVCVEANDRIAFLAGYSVGRESDHTLHCLTRHLLPTQWYKYLLNTLYRRGSNEDQGALIDAAGLNTNYISSVSAVHRVN